MTKRRKKAKMKVGGTCKGNVPYADQPTRLKWLVKNTCTHGFVDSYISTVHTMGLSSSAPTQGLAFHPCCRGYNISMNNCHHQATRTQSFHDGLVFSNRPLFPKEKIWIKVLEIERRWHGALRLGLTSYNPNDIDRNLLPPFACPDLTICDGFWAVAIPEELCRKGTELCFWVNGKGQAFYQLKGQLWGQMLFSGLPKDKHLWAMFDIYGQTKTIQLLEHQSKCLDPPNSCHQRKELHEMGRRDNMMPTSSGKHTELIQPRAHCTQESTLLDLHAEALNVYPFREDEPNCVICLDRLADTLLLPCRHCSFCKQCVQKIKRQSNMCPLCRQSIQSMRDVREITQGT